MKVAFVAIGLIAGFAVVLWKLRYQAVDTPTFRARFAALPKIETGTKKRF
jgi:hypothetical protein